MAEVLVRTVGKDQPDLTIASLASKAGDVIAVCPDGWGWTERELTNNDWRIISVNILQTTIDSLLSRVPVVGQPPRRRDWKIDFSLLPNPALFTGVRTQQIITLTRQQVTAAVVRKP